MSIRFLHLADLHLGYRCSYLADKSGERKKDFYNAFASAVGFAIDSKNRIDFVLICGDLFEQHNPDEQTISFVQKHFSNLQKHNIPVILIPGTHDAYGYSHSVYKKTTLPGVTVISNPAFQKAAGIEIRSQKVHFYGFAFDSSKTAQPLENFIKTDEDGIHISLLHCSVIENPAIAVSEEDVPISLEQIAKSKMDYVALGHYHNYHEYKRDSVTAVYPGTLEGKSFDETGDRYLVIVQIDKPASDVSSGSNIKIEKKRFNLKTLREEIIDFSTEKIETQEDLISYIIKFSDPNSLLKIYLKGTTEFVPNTEILQSLLSDKFFYLEVIDSSRVFDSGLIHKIKDEKTIRGIFVRKIMEKIEQSPTDEREIFELALKIGVDEFTKQ